MYFYAAIITSEPSVPFRRSVSLFSFITIRALCERTALSRERNPFVGRLASWSDLYPAFHFERAMS